MNIFNCRVYYEDTDALGIVYYANYLKFIERARTESLRDLGIFQSLIKKKYDLVFVIRKISAEYCLPARLDDYMEIRTVFLNIRRVTCELNQEILVEGNTIFRAKVKLGILDSKGHPKQLPNCIKDKFKKLMK